WLLILLLTGAFFSLSSERCGADGPAPVEKWADRRLPVTAGLVLWLDAANLAEGRKALGQPPLREGDPLDLWPDASGTKRHVSQDQLANQPTYQRAGDFHAVRFDGRGSHLRRTTPGQAFQQLTVFVVAAAYSNPEAFSAFLGMSERGRNDFE